MIRKIAPPVVLLAFIMLSYTVTQFKPQTKIRNNPTAAPINVEVIRIDTVDFPIKIASFGAIQARTQNMLVAQVSGQVIEVSENFRVGGFFDKDEVLVSIDDRDYEIQVEIADAELVQAQFRLLEEEARGEQAKKDWKTLGSKDRATELALSKAQLVASRAAVNSARARLAQAKLNLQRTKISASYAGRILKKNIDIGSVVSPSVALAETYATDYAEVRLPIKNLDLQFIHLPGFSFNPSTPPPDDSLVLQNRLTTPVQTWLARLVRTEGAIDSFSQQVYVVAQIDEPFNTGSTERTPLKIGQYVNAQIPGRIIFDAIVIPSAAIYQDSYVYLVRSGALYRQNIAINWRGAKQVLIGDGLKAGDQLITTPLGQLNSGTRVSIINSDDSAASTAMEAGNIVRDES